MLQVITDNMDTNMTTKSMMALSRPTLVLSICAAPYYRPQVGEHWEAL